MSFNVRLALSIGLLVACTAATGLAGMSAINALLGRLRSTDELYAELRGLYEIGHRAATARALLDAAPGSQAGVRRELLGGLHETEQLLGGIGSLPEASRESLVKDLNEIRGDFEHALAAEEPAPGQRGSAQPLQDTLGHIASLAGGVNRGINVNRQAMIQGVEAARWTLGVVFGGTLLVAAAAGLLQHRAVARPLRLLRQGVEHMAQQRMDWRMPMRGPREFRCLMHQFNCMAERLKTLQDSLHQQVEVKSRQLIFSERLAGLGYLAASLAHEINSPLGIIGGYAETMQRRLGARSREQPEADGPEGRMDGELDEALGIIREEVFRCRDITARLLELTRANDERIETLDAGCLLRSVAQRLAHLPLCRSRRLEVEQTHSAPLLVRGSRSLLTQVLMNLLSNALEAVEADGGHVKAAATSQGGSILVRIADNGCGLDPESLAHVFDPLVSHKSPSGATGFGLGLSITHAIIERHGGRIDVSSDGPGTGSIFVVELPAIAPLTAVIS